MTYVNDRRAAPIPHVAAAIAAARDGEGSTGRRTGSSEGDTRPGGSSGRTA